MRRAGDESRPHITIHARLGLRDAEVLVITDNGNLADELIQPSHTGIASFPSVNGPPMMDDVLDPPCARIASREEEALELSLMKRPQFTYLRAGMDGLALEISPRHKSNSALSTIVLIGALEMPGLAATYVSTRRTRMASAEAARHRFKAVLTG